MCLLPAAAPPARVSTATMSRPMNGVKGYRRDSLVRVSHVGADQKFSADRLNAVVTTATPFTSVPAVLGANELLMTVVTCRLRRIRRTGQIRDRPPRLEYRWRTWRSRLVERSSDANPVFLLRARPCRSRRRE